jgi:competence CoiA-like predicted nuclease
MIQYRYAKTEKNEQVDIETLDKKQGKYYCIGCRNEMIAHFWDKKGHHFQHKADYTCSLETYLHKLAKSVFLDNFKKCQYTGEPFL